MSKQTKLTQKVDHSTMFESFPNTSCCSQKVPPNKIEKIGWLDVQGWYKQWTQGPVDLWEPTGDQKFVELYQYSYILYCSLLHTTSSHGQLHYVKS